MWTVEEGIERLREAGGKITNQRIAILRAMEARTDHPSADAIFNEVKEEYPSISIATIYGTLKMMAKANLVKILSIDDKRMYFDPNVASHGHFLCESCGKLWDLEHIGGDISLTLVPHGGAMVTRFELFVYGLCRDCSTQKG
ncbi:Fe2+/Zn2+ uptake regulation protein [Thermanaerovibrio velox DSM 12556]|uniref:Fe2+/Zn2+ uptake regulation protein n=1 Tax=Thermanaerovibrio velox DSM 12556 TaxID=926567 RepID=H0URB7_9BACT|nr:Fur family transcriptional regulator [Thermanaerovibrio velox]EHM09873.1 Fe2+/Zn2+ uptake regulation protein [Thermanaerovibrio velox DSM 12556]